MRATFLFPKVEPRPVVSRLFDALELPPATRLDRRVPKTVLTERGRPVPADRRRVRDELEELRWLAVLKPSPTGIPAFEDGHRRYDEIVVFAMKSRKTLGPLARVVHRCVAYPVLLFAEGPAGWCVSLARKRFALNEPEKVVLEEAPLSVEIAPDAMTPEVERAFLEALALDRQPLDSLRSLYEGWMRVAEALQVALVSGRFVLPRSEAEARERRELFAQVRQLEKEIAGRRREAAREKQIARQVALNTEIKRLEAGLTAARQALCGGTNEAEAQAAHRG